MMTALKACTAALVLLLASSAQADQAPTSANVVTLMTRDLAGLPGKEAVMMTVEYLPGGSSLPHRHDAHVFVYVLEGSIVTQVDGQAAMTLTPGQTFYESPADVHRISENASKTEPAKFLVIMVKDKDRPLGRPASAPAG
jgi:quercetin dioxygenase-like cupin family protein